MDVGIDQARQHEAVRQIDQARAGKWRDETVLDGFDAAVPNDDRRVAPGGTAGSVEQGAGMDDDRRGWRRR